MSRPVRTRALTAATLVTLAACGGEGAGPGAGGAGVEVRDSVGVRIAVGRVPAAGFPEILTVAPSPSLTLTPPAGQGGWGDVVGVVTLAEGTVAVGDGEGGRVLFFAPDGVVVSEQGGFPGMARMGRTGGDTLWVSDTREGRLARVTPAGVVDSAPFPAGLTVAGRFEDDAYLMVPEWSPTLLGDAPAPGVRRDTAQWARWSPRGVSAELVGAFPHDELMVVEHEGDPMVATPPFGRRTSRVVAPDGFWVGDQVSFELRRHAPGGGLEEILRLEGVDLTLTEALKASVRPAPSEGEPSLVDRLWEGVPPTRPAYTRLLLDGEGRLWVAEHVAGAAPPRAWLVFSGEGAALGLVTLPEGFVPFEVGTHHVWGVQASSGGRHVVRYALEPSP